MKAANTIYIPYGTKIGTIGTKSGQNRDKIGTIGTNRDKIGTIGTIGTKSGQSGQLIGTNRENRDPMRRFFQNLSRYVPIVPI